ncbi:MAG: ComEC/Rec2 family competence protein [Prevotella sp.]|nr:ComEC/Rec2 family competence protein [Prevotella sp.]
MNAALNHHAPLLGPAVSLMAGVALMTLWPVHWPVLPLLAAFVVLTMLVSRWPLVQTLLLMADFLLLGMLTVQRQPPPVNPQMSAEAVVVSEPVEKPKTIAVDLLLPETGQRVHRYLWKDEQSRTLRLGDALILNNVGEGYVPRRDWQPGGDAPQRMGRIDRVRLNFLLWRHQLLERYRQMPMEDEAYAVLAAMTLGDKSALTAEVRETYSVTGASHVLALSGLHLGIIYMLLSRLLMGRRRFWLSQVVIVVCIWAFAFLTGLSPSVVRSATMISIYAIFSVGGRGRSSLNLLAFAAFVILLLDPASLFDVGFQLSFMAVLSILLFMPLVERHCPVGHGLLHWIRDMVGVSVAAQLGVAPLVAFYFGRFPTYFLLTNFIVIIAAPFILYGALLVVVFPSLGEWLGVVVSILNKALGWIAQMPYSSIEGLHPSVIQVCLLYAMVLLIYLITSLLSNAKYRSS